MAARTDATGTAHAILGLLSVRTWTTYELAKQVQRSLNWFWPRAERKLYDEPKRLVAGGLATATPELTGKRPRTVYTITADGRTELTHWLSQPSAPRSHEFEAMVKVFFADAGTLGQLRTTLTRIAEEAGQRVDQLRELTTAVSVTPTFPERLHLNALTVRLQLDEELAVLHWAEWAQTQISVWKTTRNPGNWDPHVTLTGVITDATRQPSPETATAR